MDLPELASPTALLAAMVSSAASSTPARGLDASFVVRGGPNPGISVFGEFDEVEERRVQELVKTVHEAVDRFQFVDYRQAEKDCVVLAQRLDDRLGAKRLEDSCFVAIPRGGFVVLGILAMVMNLRREQLESSCESASLTVFVDDAGFSGHRIKQTLAARTAGPVAIALLRAPEVLCRTIEQVEPQVVSCVAARFLDDVGTEVLGDGYEEWRSTWAALVGNDRYWVGRPEWVSFAWKEPDRSFVNRATGHREVGWSVMPRSLCLKPMRLTEADRVHVQEPAVGPLQPSDEVFFVDWGGSVVIAQPSSTDVLELQGVAAEIWRSILRLGSVVRVADDLHDRFGVTRDRLVDDVDQLVRVLLERRVLTQRDPVV